MKTGGWDGVGEGEVGRRSCELGILWSDLVRELRNNKYMENPDLLSVKEVEFGTGICIPVLCL